MLGRGIFSNQQRRHHGYGIEPIKTNASLWASIIESVATRLFWTLALISMVWTFGMMALRKADIGEFFAELIRFTVFTGFFWWLLINGPELLDIHYRFADAGRWECRCHRQLFRFILAIRHCRYRFHPDR